MDASHPSADEPWMRRARLTVVVLAVGLACSGVVGYARLVTAGLASPTRWQKADVTADWVVTRAALHGADPYADTSIVARNEGVAIADRESLAGASREAPHPRPPSAFVVLVPLLAVGARHAYAAMLLANVVLAVLLVVLIARATDRRLVPALVVGAVGLNALAARDGLVWGTQSYLMAVLVAATYLLTRNRDDWRGGVPLGVAAALKLFPLVLVVPLFVAGRRRAAALAAGVFAGTTLLGLALPGVGLANAAHALRGADGAWGASPGNASLGAGLVRAGVPVSVAGLTGMMLAGAIALLLVRRARRLAVSYWGVAVAMLLASPISWRHYDLMIVGGAVVLAVVESNRVTRASVGVFVALALVPPLFASNWEVLHDGGLGLLGRVALLAGFVACARPRARHVDPPVSGRREPSVDDDDVDALGTVHAHGDRHLEVARS